MHPLEGSVGVPAFLAKLWRLVEDPATNNLISWTTDGRSFTIQNQAKFAKDLLPLNYKHNNMASFIRQLNMYGFHKITSIDNGGLKFDKDEMEFSHPYFQKGHPYLLEHIKRKIANPKQAEAEKSTSKVETVNRVLSEVKNMRGRQESLDTRFSAMKQENEALWREVAILRQKHMKQQQIVNKLIQFLVTLVQPSRSGLGSGIGKRRFQLMINDAPQPKMKKTDDGPIIHELTEELLDEVESDFEPEQLEVPSVQSPGSISSQSPYRPGSSCYDDDVINANIIKQIQSQSQPLSPAELYSVMSNEYANHNYVLDNDGVDEDENSMNYDDVDEIDTNNMAIYGVPQIKKEKVDKPMMRTRQQTGAAESASMLQQQFKQEPMESHPTAITSNRRKADRSPAGKSLLISSKPKNIQEDSNISSSEAAADMMINLINEQQQQQQQQQQQKPIVDQSLPTTSSASHPQGLRNRQDSFLLQNELPQALFEENSQNHLDNVQNDLECLKDLLRTDSLSLDTNALLGLFGNDDIMGYEMSPSNLDMFTEKKDSDDASGSELQPYQPSTFNSNLDLNDLLQNVGED
ncbi:unnamed protein product [Diamesa serratosioi]